MTTLQGIAGRHGNQVQGLFDHRLGVGRLIQRVQHQDQPPPGHAVFCPMAVQVGQQLAETAEAGGRGRLRLRLGPGGGDRNPQLLRYIAEQGHARGSQGDPVAPEKQRQIGVLALREGVPGGQQPLHLPGQESRLPGSGRANQHQTVHVTRPGGIALPVMGVGDA